MADPIVVYPFDPTGLASTNRVMNEEIVVLPPGDRLFHYTMPKLAPFFGNSMKVKIRDLTNNVIELFPGIDYYLTHKFADASLATMHEIYGSISFLRRDIVGTLLVDYQHLGGIWTIDSDTLAAILLNAIQNPRITAWEEVVERPVDFPVIDHPWNLADMVGMKEILEVMERFYIAYLASLDPDGGGGGTGIITEHIRNKNNPHEVTAAQVGAYTKAEILGLLLGYLRVGDTAADSNKLGGYTLAEVSQQILAVKIAAALRADIATLADKATLADDSTLFSGISYTELMQRIRVSAVSSADRLNGRLPAEVAEDILKGKAADSGKLDGKSLTEIKSELQAATSDAATLQGKSLTALMADVKATRVDNATSADNAVRFGGYNFSEAAAQILLGTAADSVRLSGKTLAQIIEELQAASSDASSLQGKTLSQLMADVKATLVDRALVADSASTFGGRTYAQAVSDIRSGQSADSAKLGGKTLAEVTAAAGDAQTLQGKSLAQLMADVIATKVNSALSADNAVRINNLTYAELVTAILAGKAADAGKLDGKTFDEIAGILSDAGTLQNKTLAQIMADVKTTVVDRAAVADNATQFNSMTYAQLRDDIRSGQSADSAKLGGKTFEEIVQEVQSGDVDAVSLQGKNLIELMADVKATLVDRALVATNAELLGGSSLESIMTAITTLKPASSSDSDRVYGMQFEQLVTAFIRSQTYENENVYGAAVLVLADAIVQSPGNGGTQDPDYNYMRIGTIYLDPARTSFTGSDMVVSLYLAKEVLSVRLSAQLSESAPGTWVMQMHHFCDHEIGIGTDFTFGTRYGTNFNNVGDPSEYGEIYLKYRKTSTLEKCGVFQYSKNDFVISTDISGRPNVWDSTYVSLDEVTWRKPSIPFYSQKAVDDVADFIGTLIVQPAA